MCIEYLLHRIRLTSRCIRSDDQMTHVYSKGALITEMWDLLVGLQIMPPEKLLLLLSHSQCAIAEVTQHEERIPSSVTVYILN